MKKHSIQALAALALLASCSSDDFIGGNVTPTQPTTSNAISFEGGTGKITRANTNKTGQDAANALGEQFEVYGNKKVSENTTQTVYNRYFVNWIGKDKKTETNDCGWEYVGQGGNDKPQTIKYWDYSAEMYNFVAWSTKGAGTTPTSDEQATDNVIVSQIDGENSTKKEYTEGYILTGKASDLAKCYIADRVTAKKNVVESGATNQQENAITNRLIKYQDAVQFNFRKLETKVRIGLYETIPGYSVKDVKFYQSKDQQTNPAETPALYADGAKIPNMNAKGTIKVTFGDNTNTNNNNGDFNKAKVEWTKGTEDGNADNLSNITFKELSKKGKEGSEDPDKVYLGRTANQASLPTVKGEDKGYTSVIPANVGVLTLKVDYTLVSTDGSGETIKVTGATAQVPEQYTNWQPNYAYTYLFKITDKTNGSTGDGSDPEGLYPIVFDAVVTETEEGIQNTITTVSTPSITTYQKGNDLKDEYVANQNIYVSVVGNNGATLDLYTSSNASEGGSATYTYYGKLYKVPFTAPANSITEAEAEKILSGTTIKGKTLTEVSTSTQNNLDTRFVTEIEANDAVDGVKVSNGKFFKFNPTAAATYVFEYKKTENGTTTKAYKVIKVAAAQTTTGGGESQQGQN